MLGTQVQSLLLEDLHAWLWPVDTTTEPVLCNKRSHHNEKLTPQLERQPTPVFLPGEFQGQRSLAAYSPWGHKESDMTERLTHIVQHEEYSQCFIIIINGVKSLKIVNHYIVHL